MLLSLASTSTAQEPSYESLLESADSLLAAWDTTAAESAARVVLAQARSRGDREAVATALGFLAGLALESDPAAALRGFDEMAAMARATGKRRLESLAHNGAAAAHARLKQTAEAAAAHQRAIETAEQAGDAEAEWIARYDYAHFLAASGGLDDGATERVQKGITELQAAGAAAQRTGDADATRIVADGQTTIMLAPAGDGFARRAWDLLQSSRRTARRYKPSDAVAYHMREGDLWIERGYPHAARGRYEEALRIADSAGLTGEAEELRAKLAGLGGGAGTGDSVQPGGDSAAPSADPVDTIGDSPNRGTARRRSDGGSGPPWVLIGVAAVLLIGGGALLGSRARRRQRG